jgi:hypothetical protein
MAATRDDLARSLGWPSDAAVQTALHQIGRGNVLAISGGRVAHGTDGALILPVRYGYDVAVILDQATDTYVVERRFRRGNRRWVKARWTNVYAEDLGEVAYTASCYADPVDPENVPEQVQ